MSHEFHEKTGRPAFLTCSLDPTQVRRLRQVAAPRADVLVARTFPELIRVATTRTRPIEAIIIGRADRFDDAVATVRQLSAERLNIPIVAVCRAGVAYSGEIRALARAGIHELFFEGIDEPGFALKAVLRSALRECAAEAVFCCIDDQLPRRLRPFIEACLGRGEARSIEAIARNLGLHRTSLIRYCEQAGLPPPMEMRGWCRVMLAAHLLQHSTSTTEMIAVELDFRSPSAMRNMIRRYLGLTTREVRDAGFTSVVDAFRSACQRASSQTAIAEVTQARRPPRPPQRV